MKKLVDTDKTLMKEVVYFNKQEQDRYHQCLDLMKRHKLRGLIILGLGDNDTVYTTVDCRSLKDEVFLTQTIREMLDVTEIGDSSD